MVKGMTSEWKVRYKIGNRDLKVECVSLEQNKKRQSKLIPISPRQPYPKLKEELETIIWQFEQELIGDRSFKVKAWSNDVNDLEPRWIEGCKLVCVPIWPASTMFTFKTQEGEILLASGIDDMALSK